ncbi:protein ACCELERATED CELL DEATH 6-like [Salvia divinorum]|uniref:Protein ACCELERATED CELL DEATH 6-like n=1 Tax=Salvia divinorum TaxID=28513 RepID=A0ABD1I754_SALDI
MQPSRGDDDVPIRIWSGSDEEARAFSIRISNADDHATEIYKDQNLYLAAKNGNLEEFTTILQRISTSNHINFHDILTRSTPIGNTFLHVAAKHGKLNIANFITAAQPYLALSNNFYGETPLHLAAKSGHLSMVEALVRVHHHQPDEEATLLRAKNKKGNTALHETLLSFLENKRGKASLHGCWIRIAESLIQNDPHLSYSSNKDQESALYLAAKAGLKDCVSLILRLLPEQECLNELFNKKSPIEAAIQGKHRDVLEAMLDMKRSFFHLRDENGRNPLHHAADYGYLEGANLLRIHFPEMTTQRDKSGSFPILVASSEGHVDVVDVLLQDLPDPAEVLDTDGRNILHLAARHGRTNVVRSVLRNPHLHELINMTDEAGNTPLHLATRHWHPMAVRDFTWDKRVDIAIINDDGMTALDVAEYHMQLKDFQNIQYLTWTALMAASTPRALTGNTLGTTKTHRIDAFERQVNFLLLVSILIATVTYAAGFTVPGGYNSSDDDHNNTPGLATMLRHMAFQVFVLTDVLAMYSSLTAAVVLGWALSFDFVLVVKALHLALPLFGGALMMMCIAFTAGIYLVVHDIWWLRTGVLIMGIHFVIKLVLLGLPLCFPVSSPNIFLRYISYYPFYFLVLLNT